MPPAGCGLVGWVVARRVVEVLREVGMCVVG